MLYREAKQENEIAEVQFKNQLLASNPNLYLELFKEDLDKKEEFEIEEIVPNSEAEMQSMLRQLKKEGIIS